MASFLPNLDGLQKILKSEMTFKEKLETAKMGKSRQLAEQYLPALREAKTFEEAQAIQGAITAEAAKYGLDDLTSKINPMFDAKLKEFDKQEKVQKGQGKIGSLFQTYSGYKMKFPHDPTKLVDVGTYINAWVKGQGGMDSIGAYTNADELESAIKANITTEVTEAGLMGDTSRPVITVRKSAKSSYGANVPESFAMYRWDDKNNILWDDLNKNDKYDEGEPLGDQQDSEVQKQIQTLKGIKKEEFNQWKDTQTVALGWSADKQRKIEFNYQVEKDLKGDLEVKFTPTGATSVKSGVINSLQTTFKQPLLTLQSIIDKGGWFTDTLLNKKVKFTPKSTKEDIQRILDIKITDTQMDALTSNDPDRQQKALTMLQATLGSVDQGTFKVILADLQSLISAHSTKTISNGKEEIGLADYKRMANDIYFAMNAQVYASLGKPIPATFWTSVPYPEVAPDATKSVFDNNKANYGAFVKQYDQTENSNNAPHQRVRP